MQISDKNARLWNRAHCSEEMSLCNDRLKLNFIVLVGFVH